MVGNQIANLIFNLSFDHNLCLKCPNGLCEPVLNIYIPRTFQWYNERFNPMAFDPCNCFLKNWEFIETPTPKMGTPILPGAWDVIPKLPSWPALLQALALVVSRRLRLQQSDLCRSWLLKCLEWCNNKIMAYFFFWKYTWTWIFFLIAIDSYEICLWVLGC